MSLVWRKELSTGLAWQDEDHQQLFLRIDQLLDAMERSEGNSLVQGLIGFLGDYSRGHFEREEDYMLTHHCATYNEHKICHAQFTSQVSEILELYNKQGSSTVVVMRLQQLLRDWLINHIINIDKKMQSGCAVK